VRPRVEIEELAGSDRLGVPGAFFDEGSKPLNRYARAHLDNLIWSIADARCSIGAPMVSRTLAPSLSN